MGFEPTRGNPIGLAGRRLNNSAKVSLPTLGEPSFCVGLCGRSALVRSVAIAGLFRASASALAVGYIAQWLDRLSADQQVLVQIRVRPLLVQPLAWFVSGLVWAALGLCGVLRNMDTLGIEPRAFRMLAARV